MHVFVFNRFLLDTRRRVLLVDGQPVDLQDRPFDILEFLIVNRDRVVSRNEIMARVWEGRAVAENNLTVQMSMLRRILAEHGGDGLIITLPNKGYRFVGEAFADPACPTADPVVSEARAGALPPGPTPESLPTARPPSAAAPAVAVWRHPAIAILYLLLVSLASAAAWRHFTAPPPPPRLSIAVLPFRNLSDDRSQDYLADAITDDLTTDLAHIPGSVVIARESADIYRGRAVPTAAIGHALNVRYLLEGSIRPVEGDFRINAQLIEAATGAHLWAERWDQSLAHIALAQTAIVRRIASALDTQLTDIEGTSAQRDRPNDTDALTLFFRARSITDHEDSLPALATAQHLLELATNQAPDFADAFAQLGLTLALKIRGTDDPDDARDLAEARQMTARALQLAPHNPRALAADARLRERDNNCTVASISANEALAAESNSLDALAVLAKCALAAGRLDEAAGAAFQVLRLNPEGRSNKPRYMLLSEVRLLQGHYKEAIDLANQAIAGDPPPSAARDGMGRPDFCRLLVVGATYLSGDTSHAHDLFADYALLWPNHTVWRIAAYAPRAVAALAGYRNFMAALNAAGMPEFADEHADDHINPPAAPHIGGDFDPTPLTMPGAVTIDTAQLTALLAKSGPLTVDLGRGAAVIEGAVWSDPGAPDYDDNSFLDHALANRVKGDRDAPIVIMATGTAGYDSYNAALHAVSLGYRRVLWYRGGEEAWAAAGLPSRDRRSQ